MRRIIKKQADGTFRVRLDDTERQLLQALIPQLRELVAERDPVAWRLFPNAYQDDPAKAAEYEELVGDDLQRRRETAIATVEATLSADVLTEDQLAAWMGAVNDLRLVLGTRLDVTEESDLDDYPSEGERSLFSAYSFLGWLLEHLVRAMSRT